MSDVLLVTNWDAVPSVWHIVPDQYRADLALSLCGIDNGESWLVGPEKGEGATLCTPCLRGVLRLREEATWQAALEFSCQIVGHSWDDTSDVAGPETGGEYFECSYCGDGFGVTYY